MGFIMSQKYCKCESITTICCSDGWKVCMVGSNFTSPAESNYAQIEGECLGVVNALKKTSYYTQGCEKLVVGANHKPLFFAKDPYKLYNFFSGLYISVR